MIQAPYPPILYRVIGAIIGLCFPVAAYAIIYVQEPGNLSYKEIIVQLHLSQPYFWLFYAFPVLMVWSSNVIAKQKWKSYRKLLELEQAMESRTSDLQKRNKALQKEIEERLIAEKHLIIAKEDAERAKRAEEMFLANMSHELRTPLNGVVGFTRLLLGTELDAVQNEYTNTIQQSANHLMAIINDILEIAKIKSGEIEFEALPLSPTKLIMNAVNTFKAMASQKNLALYEEIDRKIPPYILADQTRLQQILFNLINNAIKFTEEGRVIISATLKSEDKHTAKILFKVEDTGVGISRESIGRIFDKFKQAESSTNRTHGGTGLGLAICKEMVELQGGSIWVESELGKGSIFYFDLSFKKASSHQIAEPNKGAIELKDIGNLNLLLVEDNKINVKLAENVFKKWGDKLKYKVAFNGQEAIDLHKEHNFDVILMDLQMPIMDGFTATEKIRKELEAPYNNVPIIALTANVMISEKQKAFEAGIDDYITKPFDANKLFTSITQIKR